MQAFKEQGNTYFAEGKYAEARALFTKAIESGGDEASLAQIHSNRAACSMELHLYEEAEEDAGRAILLDPSFAEGYYRRALARRGLGKLEDAVKDCELALVPGDGDMEALLANCRLLLQSARGALSTYLPKLDPATQSSLAATLGLLSHTNTYLPLPTVRLVAAYLQRNFYTPLTGDPTPVPLRGTTSRALHDEIMAIGRPFHLVLTDLGEGDIMDGFLDGCKHVVLCYIHALKITRIGFSFLRGCTSLSSIETTGLTSVKTIGYNFLGGCTSLSSFDTSGLTSVTTIGDAIW